LTKGTAVERIVDRAASYSMPGVRVDANDPIAMYQAAGEAIERARRGDGPTLIEAMTYRFNGHVIGDQQVYIPKEELAAAVAADPVLRFRQKLIDDGTATAEELDRIDAELADEIADASQFAIDSPLPDASTLTTDVYSQESLV
jgi:pyruvate dehydrogenase E1 component alpha subunit